VNTKVDRRHFSRFPALGNRTCLEWWEGTERHKAVGNLLNVSRGGALIETEAMLPDSHPLWMRIEEPAHSGWIGARLVRRQTDLLAAIAFHHPCPFDFLESARLGISLDHLM
jgi:hypothetical protein